MSEPRIMGIVNVTPDSFSDGGSCLETGRAIEQGLRLEAEGADILDIGGESTRPDAEEVEPCVEMRRVLPVIRELAKQVNVPLSVDTRHPEVAREALAAGASIVNDVKPFSGDVQMAAVVREAQAGLVMTHARGTPQTMRLLAVYDDVVKEVEQALRQAWIYAENQGIRRTACVIDPGLGFAKTTAHNVAILSELSRFCDWAPVLVGASRKRFIGEIGGEPDPRKRMGGSIAAALWGVLQGASIVRVHDVKETKEAIQVMTQLRKSRCTPLPSQGGCAHEREITGNV